MRAVIQRVSESSVTTGGLLHAEIGEGMTILLGIEESDNETDIEWLCKKIVNLRIFDDGDGVMNRSILENGGDILLISQFTLYASTRKGNRPSYIRAAKPEAALPLYELFIENIEKNFGKRIKSGIFGANMKIHLINDGPVTIIIDTKNRE